MIRSSVRHDFVTVLVMRNHHMFDRHQRNIEELNSHLQQSNPVKPTLTTAAYVDEVTRHLARIRPQPVARAPRRT